MSTNYCHGCMARIAAYPCPNCGYTPMYNVSPYSLRPGTILNGKYLIGRVLGQGGFGITYIGMDLQLQRKVAIKEYYPANCVGRESGTNRVVWYSSEPAQAAMLSGQELFLKEARKMSRVSAIAAVVQVFSVFQENGTAYICMDFIEGRTLQQLLKQAGPLPWEQAKKIFLPLIQDMAEVHRLGLIHRDLSPDNLMIQPDGHVKILDLGAAKDLNLNSGKSSMQVAKGGFSPLEQYMQSGSSGSWTDVYSMASSMYYTLTGVVPPSAIDRLNSDTIRWDLPQLQKLPPEVCSALKHAMAVRLEDRTQTMEAFSQELQRNIIISPKSKKPSAALLAAALAVAAAVAIGISSTPTGKNAPDAAPSVPAVTDAVSATEKSIPAVTESVSGAEEAELEALIKDIDGLPVDELRSIYAKAVEHEQFWESEGPSRTVYTELFQSTSIHTTLLDKYGQECGSKTYTVESKKFPYLGNNTTMYDTINHVTINDNYTSDGIPESKGKTQFDADSNIIRQINISYDSIGKIDYITDTWGEDTDIHVYIYEDSYSIEVKDHVHNIVLQKKYDLNGKLITSS